MLAAALIALATVAPMQAQGGATARPDPPTLEVGLGQQETLNIVLEDAQDVYGIDVRAKFDPAVIEVVDADPSKDGVQMTPGTFIKPDFLVRNTAENVTGTLQYVTTQVNPSPPVSGRGIVVSVLVRGKALGKQTAFTISFVEIADRTGRKLPVRGQAGNIVVVQPKPPTPTPTAQATATPTAAPSSVPSPTPPRAAVTTAGVTPAATVVAQSTPAAQLSDDSALVGIAVAGVVGALAIAGAGVVILRRPRL
ncbi:MAG: hypothetical protein HZB53_15295 [Chloroflexi bacterium]|nr:hypothetical protein [Chloroflexota bacterium]